MPGQGLLQRGAVRATVAGAMALLLGACQGTGAPSLRPVWAIGQVDSAGVAWTQATSASSGGALGLDANLLSFEERFLGPRLDPLNWLLRPEEGSIMVGGGEVVVAAPNGGRYPLLATLGQLWPQGRSWVLSLSYRVQGPAQGTALLFGEGSAPPAGVDVAPLVRAEAEGPTGLRVQVLGPDGQWRSALAPHGLDARPATAPHAFLLEGDARGQLRVLVDGAEVLQAPVAGRISYLALGAQDADAPAAAWPEWRLGAVQAGPLQRSAPAGPAATPYPIPTPVATPAPPVATPAPPVATPTPAPTPTPVTRGADPTPAAATPSPEATPSPSPTPSPEAATPSPTPAAETEASPAG